MTDCDDASREHTDSTADIRLAVCSLLWARPAGEEFASFLKEAKQAGYEGVAGFAHGDLRGFIDAPASLGSMLSAEDLSMASVDSDIRVDFDYYRRVCDFMATLDCSHLVLLGGQGKQEGDFPALAALLNHIGEIAQQRGVFAHYHNHTGCTGETFEDMDKLLAYTDPDKLGVMCDVGHATKDFINQPVAERAIRFLKKYWDRLGFIEFKDWHSETDLNTPVGEGLCDWEAVFGIIEQRGYSGWITVEQNEPSRNRTPLECARVSREFIRKGLRV